MTWRAGQQVEVKVGGSLGQWVPGTVLAVAGACCGRSRYDVVTDGGRRVEDVPESSLRRPRRPAVVVASPAPPKRKPRKTGAPGRGPLRFDEYRRWVKTKPCIFCFQKADDPHHYGPKGMGQTTDDTRLTPVCRGCHDALHDRRVKDLPAAYRQFNDPHHNWAVVEAHVYRRQGDFLAEFLRVHGELR